MRGTLVAALLLMLSVAVQASEGAGAPTPELPDAAQCAMQYRNLFAVVDTSEVDRLPDLERQRLFTSASLCAHYLGDSDLQHRYAQKAIALGNDPVAWRLRLAAETFGRSPSDAVPSLEQVSTQAPLVLADLPTRWLETLYRRLGKDKKTGLQTRVLAVVAHARQPFKDEIQPVDWLLGEYATRNPADAGTVVKRINHSATLRKLSLTPGVRNLFPADFDSRKETEAELARLKTLAGRYPDRVEIRLDIARQQRTLGKPADALATLMAADPTKEGHGFIDGDAKANWWLNDLAGVYSDLGRFDESIAALRQGMALREDEGGNVSQTINLASHLDLHGRYQEALATLNALQATNASMSLYGKAAWHTIRACALAKSNHRAEALKEARELEKLQTVYSRGTLETQLCLGDLDAAAATLIAHLADRQHTADMLLLLSDYSPGLSSAPISTLDKGLTALKQRPDVISAIAKAGGTRRFNVVG